MEFFLNKIANEVIEQISIKEKLTDNSNDERKDELITKVIGKRKKNILKK